MSTTRYHHRMNNRSKKWHVSLLKEKYVSNETISSFENIYSFVLHIFSFFSYEYVEPLTFVIHSSDYNEWWLLNLSMKFEVISNKIWKRISLLFRTIHFVFIHVSDMSNIEYRTIIKLFTLKELKEVYDESAPAHSPLQNGWLNLKMIQHATVKTHHGVAVHRR